MLWSESYMKPSGIHSCTNISVAVIHTENFCIFCSGKERLGPCLLLTIYIYIYNSSPRFDGLLIQGDNYFRCNLFITHAAF